MGAVLTDPWSIRTLLNLSLNTVALPACWRDQPSGIFTVYPPPDGDQATKTWSSGMSPAGFTSLGGAAAVEDPEGDVPEDPDEEEQATAPVTTTRPDTRADNVRRMENTSALAKEPTGMPPRPRRYEPGGQCQGPDELAGG
ncbi:hypothetical protein ABID95_004734 [Streptomyces atratus]|uniref:hypothetical protein n=1 Tax=Streptomyces atratus TaxID=1893 RepID=UPI00339ACDB3